MPEKLQRFARAARKLSFGGIAGAAIVYAVQPYLVAHLPSSALLPFKIYVALGIGCGTVASGFLSRIVDSRLVGDSIRFVRTWQNLFQLLLMRSTMSAEAFKERAEAIAKGALVSDLIPDELEIARDRIKKVRLEIEMKNLRELAVATEGLRAKYELARLQAEVEIADTQLFEAKHKTMQAQIALEQAAQQRAKAEAARVRADAEVHRAEAERAEAKTAKMVAEIEAEQIKREGAESARVEAERVEAARAESARVEAERVEAARAESVRVEAERAEAARAESVRVEVGRVEAEIVEAARVRTARVQPVAE